MSIKRKNEDIYWLMNRKLKHIREVNERLEKRYLSEQTPPPAPAAPSPAPTIPPTTGTTPSNNQTTTLKDKDLEKKSKPCSGFKVTGLSSGETESYVFYYKDNPELPSCYDKKPKKNTVSEIFNSRFGRL